MCSLFIDMIYEVVFSILNIPMCAVFLRSFGAVWQHN